MEIKTFWQFNIALDHGPYAWPGGYPMYFVCGDGGALSFEAAKENANQIRDALITNDRHSDWFVVGFEVNWEDTDLICSHTNTPIQSAHGND